MKNFLLTLITASFFVACKTEPKNDLAVKTDLVPVNTAGYNMSNASTDVAKPGEQETYETPARKKKYSVRTKISKSNPVVEEAQKQPITPATQQAPGSSDETAANNNQQNSTPDVKTTGNTAETSSGQASTSNAGVGETAGAEKETRKKGWSNAAKGAVIGGAAGAIGGAIINGKNRAVGAAIGAVLGAAGGYAIGRKKDKDKESDAKSNYNMAVN